MSLQPWYARTQDVFKGLTLHRNPAAVVFSDEMCVTVDRTINVHKILLQSDTENVLFFKDLTKELQKIENKITIKKNKNAFPAFKLMAGSLPLKCPQVSSESFRFPSERDTHLKSTPDRLRIQSQ